MPPGKHAENSGSVRARLKDEGLKSKTRVRGGGVLDVWKRLMSTLDLLEIDVESSSSL